MNEIIVKENTAKSLVKIDFSIYGKGDNYYYSFLSENYLII